MSWKIIRTDGFSGIFRKYSRDKAFIYAFFENGKKRGIYQDF